MEKKLLFMSFFVGVFFVMFAPKVLAQSLDCTDTTYYNLQFNACYNAGYDTVVTNSAGECIHCGCTTGNSRFNSVCRNVGKSESQTDTKPITNTCTPGVSIISCEGTRVVIQTTSATCENAQSRIRSGNSPLR